VTITLRVLGLTLLDLTVTAAGETTDPERAAEFAQPVGFYVPDLPDRHGDYYED
jgi:hypothetical protein